MTLDVAVRNFAICEVRSGYRLVGTPVDAIMVHYVLAGTLHMAVPGHETVICGPGSVAMVPPRLQSSMTADAKPAEQIVGVEQATVSRGGLLVFDAAKGGPGELRMACGLIVASLSGSFGIFDKLEVPICEDLSDVEFVRHAYSVMLDEIAQPGLGTHALTGALMKTCLVMVIRRFLGRPGADEALIGALADPRLAAAVAAVLDKPAAPHTVARLAAIARMSRSTFARKFTEVFGIGPMEFVAKTRLYHAADLLRSTKLPIKVITASVGFASRSHFSRAFRDAYGSDPSNFRKAAAIAALDVPRPLPGLRRHLALREDA